MLLGQCGGELGIRTLGGFTHTAFRVVYVIATMAEVNGKYGKIGEAENALPPLTFSASLLKKFRSDQGFEPCLKTGPKTAFRRDFGEKQTLWREIRREPESIVSRSPSAVGDYFQDGDLNAHFLRHIPVDTGYLPGIHHQRAALSPLQGLQKRQRSTIWKTESSPVSTLGRRPGNTPFERRMSLRFLKSRDEDPYACLAPAGWYKREATEHRPRIHSPLDAKKCCEPPLKPFSATILM